MRDAFMITGNHGTLYVERSSGLIFDRDRVWEHDDWLNPPDSFEDAYPAFGGAMSAYDDIARFDMAEYFLFLEAFGLRKDRESGADILALGYWTRDGDFVPPELEWRADSYADA